MNILGNNSAKLNEIIFENKNKNYGAYAIRSEYNESLLKSLASLTGLLICIFGITYYVNRGNGQPDSQKFIPLVDLDSMITIEYNHIEQPKEPKVTPPQTQQASAAASGGGTPIISDTAPLTATVNTNNPLNGQGPSTATGTSITNTAITTNSIITTNLNEGTTITETVSYADDMPEFNSNPNGIMIYVGSNVNYPELAKEIHIEGTVYTSFIVNEFGAVENIKIVKGIGYGCDEEVMRVISKMPNWKKAGKHGGKAVKVRYTIPVKFKLR